jgi:glycosyltransferase involved in cell wall biosynthesis
LDPLPPDSELIIAADGAVDDCRPLAARHGARVVTIEGPAGPAVARNTAARTATGDVLLFVDADVVVSSSGLARVRQIFNEQPRIVGAFGAYDEQPADPGFMSQYKNLSHSFIHHSSAGQARTFWAGFGAVRRDAFQRVGGFDERFARPSVEDIDLGYRLTRAGCPIVLDTTLSARHLKRWTLGSAIVSDVRDRGIPWTQLILRYGALANDLNLRIEHQLSMVLVYLTLACLMLAALDVRTLALAPALMALVTVLNGRYYMFFYRKRGASFVARVWALHALHHLYNGLSFAAGVTLFISARHLGVRPPGSLSVDAWNAVPAETPAPVWTTDPATS